MNDQHDSRDVQSEVRLQVGWKLRRRSRDSHLTAKSDYRGLPLEKSLGDRLPWNAAPSSTKKKASSSILELSPDRFVCTCLLLQQHPCFQNSSFPFQLSHLPAAFITTLEICWRLVYLFPGPCHLCTIIKSSHSFLAGFRHTDIPIIAPVPMTLTSDRRP